MKVRVCRAGGTWFVRWQAEALVVRLEEEGADVEALVGDGHHLELHELLRARPQRVLRLLHVCIIAYYISIWHTYIMPLSFQCLQVQADHGPLAGRAERKAEDVDGPLTFHVPVPK